MRYIIMMILSIFALSCGLKPQNLPTEKEAMAAHLKGQLYCALLSDSSFEKCEKLTLKALVSASCPQDVSRLETKGKWSADSIPCYPTIKNSSISKDMIIAVMHYALTKRDSSMIKRLIAFGEANSWIMGQGSKEDTDMTSLSAMAYVIKSRLDGETKSPYERYLSIKRGQLTDKDLSLYIWLQGRVNKGELSSSEISTLESLYKSNQDDVIIVSMYHVYVNGNLKEVYDNLLQESSFSSSPAQQIGPFGMHAYSSSVYYLIALAIAEGL